MSGGRKSPAFSFYPGDFVRDTVHLTTEEVGAYWLLCCAAWTGVDGCQQGFLPDDDRKLARISRISSHKWKKVSPAVRQLFRFAEGGLLYQKRLLEELDRQLLRSDSARKSAGIRWSKRDAIASETQSVRSAAREAEDEDGRISRGERGQGETPTSDRDEFLAWAVEECWGSHLEQWRMFYRDLNGQELPSEPAIKPYAGAIRSAIRRHDAALIEAGDREQFRAKSWARAAGIGIYLDPWFNGTDPKNDAANGGKRLLEHWRPWKRQRGKPDPVPRFAELYFEVSGLQSAAREANG